MSFKKIVTTLFGSLVLSTGLLACGGVEGEEGFEDVEHAASEEYEIMSDTPNVGKTCTVQRQNIKGKYETCSGTITSDNYCKGTLPSGGTCEVSCQNHDCKITK